MSVQRDQVRKRKQVMERVIDVVKVIGKCELSYRGHRHEAVYNLENMADNHGIVTRCPLELRLCYVSGVAWKAAISYRDKRINIGDLSEVAGHVKEAQNELAGEGVGICDELISLKIMSSSVCDLSLIDLPGITRLPVQGQPEDMSPTILTKPDLIDRGTEKDVLDIVRNKIIPLNMGYIIEKCRGQKQINDGVTINDAIEEERDFFENHDEFREN
nr:unnamed protein product [Salmo salar]|eukprot:XP_013998960.1 PREDICTED: interferon-induced GTP-binding protein Mx-like isoform X1 [Salmo salar]